MNPEDRLRSALRHEADGIEPSGSWADVDARRRRLERRSRLARVAVILVLVAGAVGLAVGAMDEGDDEVTVANPDTGPVVGDRGIWPFVSAVDTKYADQAPFDTTDPAATAEAFVTTVLAPARFTLGEAAVDGGEAEVALISEGGGSMVVGLARLEGTQHWTVTAMESADITVERPAPGGRVAVPVPVAGRATTVDGTVHLAVLERNVTFVRPRELVQNTVTGEAGTLEPFTAELELDPAGVADGRITILAFTLTEVGGPIDRVTAVPAVLDDGVDHGPPAAILPTGDPLAGDEVVVVRTTDVPDDPDEQSVEVWSTSGERRRTLLDGLGTAEGGVLDLEVSADRRTVLLAVATSACTSEVVAIAADGSSGEVPLGPGEAVALTPDGSHLAALTFQGCGEGPAIEQRNVDGSGDPVRTPLDGPASELVWIDDTTLVYATEAGLGRSSVVDGSNRSIPVPDGPRYSAPARKAPGTLTVIESDGEARRVVELDAATGVVAEVGVLADGAGVYRHWWSVQEPGVYFWVGEGGVLHQVVDGESRVVVRDIALAAG